MALIFISYSRVDKSFTKVLAERLRQIYGHDNVWWDDSLHGGDIWWDEILNQVAAADIFIYLLSNESVTSPYCQAEFEEAQRLQKRIITVQVRDRTNLTSELGDIQYVDMKTGSDDTASYNLLIASISKQMQKVKKHARPLWKDRTARPGKAEPEPGNVNRPDVTTPDLRPVGPSPVRKTSGRWNSRRVIVSGVAVIALVIIGALIASKVFPGPASTATPTTPAVAQNPTATATDTPTITLTPSHTPTETSTATEITCPPGYPGCEPITANDQWNVVSQDFNGVEMMLVPAGCFMMGSEDGDDNEKPVHQQCFDEPFWIDRYEVTNAQFDRLGGVASSRSHWTDNNLPRETITWFEVQDFCELRGGRLPTEAEWEYAARGPDNLVYPWGNDFVAENAVYSGNSGNQTAEVGSKPGGVSWVGAYDMSGNVWEWVSSLYADYPYDAAHENSSDTNNTRVLRGGSWNYSFTINLRAAVRGRYGPGGAVNYFGFRCARSYDAGE